MGIGIFYSYAREDGELRQRLGKHLAVLRRQYQILDWHDGKIVPGTEWDREIKHRLANSDVILLLISMDFLDSDYISRVEIKEAMRRHDQGSASVIPIILRPCDWKNSDLAKLNVLPTGGKPVAEWGNRDKAYLDIVGGVRRVIEERIAKGQPIERSKRDIPWHLPFLCDRRSQDDSLDIALNSQERGSGPFICIIHGNEEECPDEYGDRLRRTSLARFLPIDRRKVAIDSRQLRLPSQNLGRQKNLLVLQRNLAEEFCGRRDAAMEEVAAEMVKIRAPVVVYSKLSTEEWEKEGSEYVGCFLEYWQGFPSLPPGRYLVCCLLLEHKTQSRKAKIGKNKAVEFLNKLSFGGQMNVSGQGYGHLGGQVLPELPSVTRGEAIDWINDASNFGGYCSIHQPGFCDVYQSRQAIDGLYAESRNRIPMKTLAANLMQILERYSCDRKER